MEYTFPMRVLFWAAIMLLFTAAVSAVCDPEDSGVDRDKTLSLKYKGAAIASIFVASAVGVCLPLLGKRFLRPGSNLLFIFKSFDRGEMLSTGFLHVLRDAFENLTSPCLPQHPWRDFPFTGFVAMVAAIATLIADSYTMAYFRRRNQGVPDGQERHAPAADSGRERVITQVLELGIVVYTVIIGIALGASESPKTIGPLIAALSFHMFLEGIGLGGSITQAKFGGRTTALMAVFFAIMTPTGIAIGIGISNAYTEDSPTTLIVQGLMCSASAGILIYMALVDLLSTDFMSPALQGGGVLLLLGANVSLLLGAGCISIITKWI